MPDEDKLSNASPNNKVMVIEVLKAGVIYADLLSGFERAFVNEITPRFSKYGFDMTIKGKQWNIFLAIAEKLNLNIRVRSLPERPNSAPTESIDTPSGGK